MRLVLLVVAAARSDTLLRETCPNERWEAASGRRVAAIDGYRAIAPNSTSALLAALSVLWP